MNTGRKKSKSNSS